jgi:uncharacterized delta-60 repeat protein
MRSIIPERLERRHLLAAANIVNGGDLDPTFGEGGRVVIDVAPRADRAMDMVRLSDGRLLMLGLHAESDELGYGRPYVAVTRLNTDGTRDATFGTNGIARLSDNVVNCASMIVSGDGKIILAGLGRGIGTATQQGVYDLVVARLLRVR